MTDLVQQSTEETSVIRILDQDGSLRDRLDVLVHFVHRLVAEQRLGRLSVDRRRDRCRRVSTIRLPAGGGYLQKRTLRMRSDEELRGFAVHVQKIDISMRQRQRRGELFVETGVFVDVCQIVHADDDHAIAVRRVAQSSRERNVLKVYDVVEGAIPRVERIDDRSTENRDPFEHVGRGRERIV